MKAILLSAACLLFSREEVTKSASIAGVYISKGLERSLSISVGPLPEQAGTYWVSVLRQLWAAAPEGEGAGAATRLVPLDKTAGLPTISLAGNGDLVLPASATLNLNDGRPLSFHLAQPAAIERAFRDLWAGAKFVAVKEDGDSLVRNESEIIVSRGPILERSSGRDGRCSRLVYRLAQNPNGKGPQQSAKTVAISAEIFRGKGAARGAAVCGAPLGSQQEAHDHEADILALLDDHGRLEALLEVGYMAFTFYVRDGVRMDA